MGRSLAHSQLRSQMYNSWGCPLGSWSFFRHMDQRSSSGKNWKVVVSPYLLAPWQLPSNPSVVRVGVLQLGQVPIFSVSAGSQSSIAEE